MLLGRLVVRGFQSYWRLTRGLNLGVEACVVSGDNQVLLAETSANGGGWRLPAGLVLKGETVEAALRRSLLDDFGIEIEAAPRLHWIYAERAGAPTQQTALYIVREWHYSTHPPAAKTASFRANELPATIAPRIAARVSQGLEGRAPTEVC